MNDKPSNPIPPAVAELALEQLAANTAKPKAIDRIVAANRLRQYVGKASFAHGADRQSALECVELLATDNCEVLRARLAKYEDANGLSFQGRVMPWLLECFGVEIASDTVERNHRFLEEALELVQACGCPADEAHKLVDYVYGRPVGEKSQEVGGVMVTLAALCLAQGLDMHMTGETELARITQPAMVERIREKQKRKPAMSPLPGSYPERASLTASAPTYRTYTTTPGEAVAGIALRQLGDESRWVEIRDLNAHAFPDIGPHDYYPVGTELRLPALSAVSHGEQVRDGCKLVPVQMTDEMRDAGNVYTLSRGTLMRLWADVLAAAPSPGSQKEQE